MNTTMPPKRKTQKGGSATTDALLAAARFIKDKKLISQGLSLLPGATAQSASQIASQMGFGKKKAKRKTPQRGGSVFAKDWELGRGPIGYRAMNGGSFLDDLIGSVTGGIGNLARGVGGGIGSILRGSGAGRRTVRAQL